MARKIASTTRAGRSHQPASSTKAAPAVLDVTIVLLEAGYASTAIGPLEVFHSAGVIWNWLHGEPLQPRFRVRGCLDRRP